MSVDNDEKGGIDPPQDTDPTPTPASKAKQVSTDDIESMSDDELREHLRKTRKALKQANSEAASGREARRKLQEIEDEVEERKKASLSELERAQRRIAELEREKRESDESARRNREGLLGLRRDREVEDEARKQGVSNPRLAAELLRGRVNNGIDYDEEGDRFVGVEKAVQRLLKDYPEELVRAPQRRPSGTPPRDNGPSQKAHHQDVSQEEIDRASLLSSQTVRYQRL